MPRATGPTAFILPAGGIQQWDQEGEPLHEPEALAAFVDEMRASVPAECRAARDSTAHINDAAFVAKALEIFDRWVAEGIVPPGAPAGRLAA